jgi:succinate dehydrogenase/fumarate reductase flavoprotein subunit
MPDKITLLLGETMQNDDPALNCDLLVIGLGITGAAAALEARARGADVLVLERATAGGGTSALSDGVIYLGGGTRLQRDLGVQDDPESLYAFLNAIADVPEKDILRKFCDGNPEHFDWLEAQGVPFARILYTDKHLCPSGGEGLYSTGNEKVWPYRNIARPALRGHLVTGPARNCGLKLMEVLLQRCKDVGVRILGDSRVTRLVQDDTGRVTGAAFRRDGKDCVAHAIQGVVIATGGYQMNREMIAAHNPWTTENAEPIGTDYSDGSGIEIATSIGADVAAMDAIHATAAFYPPAQLIKGIVVNRDGKRFVAEDSYHGRTAAFIFEQPGQQAYLIVDSETFAYPELAEFFGIELVDGWSSVAEMERDLAMPEGALKVTMSAYNGFAAKGEDPEFGKYPDWLQPLDKAPYAAFNLSVGKTKFFFHSLGGIKVDADARVIGSNGSPIAGLYAAGSCAAGMVRTPKGYGSGMTLANGSFFGRVAAQHAVGQASRPSQLHEDAGRA